MNTIYATHKTPMIVPFVAQVGQGKKRKQKGKGLSDVAKKGIGFLKDTQLLSNGLKLINNDKAQIAGSILSQIGLGKKKARKPKKQAGRGIFGDAFGGLGNLAYGIGAGGGALSHGLFGGSKRKGKKLINM